MPTAQASRDPIMFLLAVKDDPELLPAGPASWLDEDLATGVAMERRRAEGHPCQLCDSAATTAMAAHTKMGPRWLDLCIDCYDATRRRMIDAP